MDRNDQPRFTGNTREDLVSLARCLRNEGFVVAAESPEPLTEDFTVGVNDGDSMLVSSRPAIESELDQVSVSRFAVGDLPARQETVERGYWALRGQPLSPEWPDALRGLDRKLLQVYWEAGEGDGDVSFDVGVHTAFFGSASTPCWSLFVQNEVLRKLVCSRDADLSCTELFAPSSAEDAAPRITGMSSFNPLLPVGLCVPRAVQQLRAQCLDPDGILMARRGLVLRANSAEELWQTYRMVIKRIEDAVHARLRKLPWIFENTDDLMPEEHLHPAAETLIGCVGDSLDVCLWESSRVGILRKVACAPEVLEVLERGFPDFSTGAFGGIVPMVVRVDPRDSTKRVSRRITEAWESYRTRYSQETPLRLDGTVHRPSVILVSGLGVWTSGTDEPAAHRAYVALSESISVLEGARAFGGMMPLPYEEALCVASAPGRYPKAVAAAEEAEFEVLSLS